MTDFSSTDSPSDTSQVTDGLVSSPEYRAGIPIDLADANFFADDREHHARIFTPALYLQRYWRVRDILKHFHSTLHKQLASKDTVFTFQLPSSDTDDANSIAEVPSPRLHVLDIGCSNMAFFTHIKTCECISCVTCVDIDADLLSKSVFRLEAMPSDRLCPVRCTSLRARAIAASFVDCTSDILSVSSDKQIRPLNDSSELWEYRTHDGLEKRDVTDVAQGDVTDVTGSLLAVTAIEFIEHLHAPELSKFPEIVFGEWKPHICIITTPNSEFNVILDGFSRPMDADQAQQTAALSGDPTSTARRFRHWDHKFEWTRSEFQQWCLRAVIDRYSEYQVVFDGLGVYGESIEAVAANQQKYGHCTQIAVFTLRSMSGCHGGARVCSTSDSAGGVQQTLCAANLLCDTTWPYMSLQRRLCRDVVYWTRYLGRRCRYGDELGSGHEDGDQECADGRCMIPLAQILPFIHIVVNSAEVVLKEEAVVDLLEKVERNGGSLAECLVLDCDTRGRLCSVYDYSSSESSSSEEAWSVCSDQPITAADWPEYSDGSEWN